MSKPLRMVLRFILLWGAGLAALELAAPYLRQEGPLGALLAYLLLAVSRLMVGEREAGFGESAALYSGFGMLPFATAALTASRHDSSEAVIAALACAAIVGASLAVDGFVASRISQASGASPGAARERRDTGRLLPTAPAFFYLLSLALLGAFVSWAPPAGMLLCAALALAALLVPRRAGTRGTGA